MFTSNASTVLCEHWQFLRLGEGAKPPPPSPSPSSTYTVIHPPPSVPNPNYQLPQRKPLG